MIDVCDRVPKSKQIHFSFAGSFCGTAAARDQSPVPRAAIRERERERERARERSFAMGWFQFTTVPAQALQVELVTRFMCL